MPAVYRGGAGWEPEASGPPDSGPPGQQSPVTSEWPSRSPRSRGCAARGSRPVPPSLRAHAQGLNSLDPAGKSAWTGPFWKHQAETRAFWRNTKPTICSGQESRFLKVISVQRAEGWLREAHFF